ncbi:hypothetical protein IMCC3317_07060 [Kordia antarctica]|uniref:Uncharacterized protein n=1 Tax=Kordia antarctica TaxID=1218801 RepID=A0A7L4ZFU8_9FLAO|nr:hypothetical protein [Kordia antarctica]QHI35360.1 hypothetical protein IMCC3317_07060 [Kordia antarctica]
MKKLEDFNCEKVEIDSIFGGRMASNTFSSNTVTVGSGAPADGDDGSDEDWDDL